MTSAHTPIRKIGSSILNTGVHSMKKIIIVAEKFAPYLKTAGQAAAGRLGSDAYDYVKRHLSNSNVPHHEKTIPPHQIPSGHVGWYLS
jgi:hypothetical protein